MAESVSGEREFDVVLFGATGFTGGLTADYLARAADPSPGVPLRWALAGRSTARLEGVRSRLAAADPRWADLELLVADASEPATLSAVAERTRVVLSAVGPYVRYGEPVVAACAAAGTDYADMTGEAEFVDRMWLAHHETAVATGARLVHACGFDSVPHDLGAFFTVRHLSEDHPIRLRGVVRAGGMFSGGTFHSTLEALSRPREMRTVTAERRRAEARPEGRSSRPVAGTPHRDPVLGYWLMPLPTIDPLVVARSGAALASYGPQFRYSHYAGTKTLRYAAGGALAVGALATAARVGPVRRLLAGRVPPGSGPDERRRDRSWFTVDFVGESGGKTVLTRVSGGDPYTETATMAAEAALCLAFDDNPSCAGQVTTAQAMGEALTARLVEAGIRFEVR